MAGQAGYFPLKLFPVNELFTKENIATLASIFKEYCELIDDFSNYMNGKTINPLQQFARDILLRIRINSQSISLLCSSLYEQPTIMMSVFLIVRNIYSDFITFIYLMSIADHPDKDKLPPEERQKAFENELSVLEMKYYKSMIASADIETKMPKYNKSFEFIEGDKRRREELLDKYKDEFRDLYIDGNVNNKLKSNADLRSTTTPLLIPNEKKNARLTDAYMIDFAINIRFPKYALIDAFYRIASQFHHYSQNSNQFLTPDAIKHLFFYLIFSFNYLTILTQMLIQLIDGKDSDFIEKTKNLETRMDEILKR